MKTVGIALLFGLCAMIGIRLSAKKTARLGTARTLRKDLQFFSDRIVRSGETLVEIASGEGMLFDMLGAYLEALSDGASETDAAEHAAEGLRKGSAEEAGMQRFFTGMSGASRSELITRVNVLSPVLERVENEAEADAKQARVLRISGVLVGAGIAILLL